MHITTVEPYGKYNELRSTTWDLATHQPARRMEYRPDGGSSKFKIMAGWNR